MCIRDSFCIFHNISSSVEIKNKVTELLLSCRPEKVTTQAPTRKKGVTFIIEKPLNKSKETTFTLPKETGQLKDSTLTTETPTRKKGVTFIIEKPLSKSKETTFTLPKETGQLIDSTLATQAPTRKKEVTFILEKPLSKSKETTFTSVSYTHLCHALWHHEISCP